MSVLHLTQKEVILIRQDALFGEIFIRLVEAKAAKTGDAGEGS
jgi:chromatin segregation and condensation protein Rec8/ScpA/Scc1 (kleisin family)